MKKTHKNIAPFTHEVVTLRYLEKGVDISRIRWAEKMLIAGFDSPHLRVLVGEKEPFNKFELDDIFDKSAREISLPKITSLEEAINTYTTAKIQRFLNGSVGSRDTLYDLKELYNEYEYTEIYDFYLLYFAAIDLIDNEIQWYWPEATRKNIKKIIKKRCCDWDKKNNNFSKWANYEWLSTS